ncbi:hypothetical protein K227x_04470 [Rubripirellula lacrimiformis]|uniref:Cytochrome c domain-containing protein n=1 Tax=Rubripirellula lacrimiformis TaxID=1930273 RepID=A0A517N4L1_9BACT|nr:DUF1549 and DUF1553 domain-containing protein [Rubripirellula lacrimiformis]QDT02076.1 hypothetical protein K227x_04470 [Rubripirellula lacrimiformis]
MMRIQTRRIAGSGRVTLGGAVTRRPAKKWIGRWMMTVGAVISSGLPVPLPALAAEESQDESAKYVETAIDPYDRDHWAFQPIANVDVPVGGGAAWGNHPIDAFLFRELERQGLRPQPPAPAHTLIRRLTFDLTGLPPTPSEIAEFQSDDGRQAYARVVDRLLDSPRYGERWAQHWLDLARFAETDGFEHDKVRADAWTYRDWVVSALNDDMPYDEFVRRQIAGDELYPDDPSARTATRFCLSGPDMPDINLAKERQHSVLNEVASAVGEVFLGLQVGCAQCHDHKYDAISQADFYRLRAVFEPAVKLRKNQSLSVLDETFPYEHASHLMLRGDFRRLGPELDPGVIRVVSTKTNVYLPQPTDGSAGLRTGLANWLVSRDNPLTARVIVNRVWQHHFGTGLVETPSEFGVMGADPSNSDLLDWLATELVRRGWSLKDLHRLIVTSAAYRQHSRLADDASPADRDAWAVGLKQDPHNRLLWRYPRWRLEGEAIRDALLASSGQINFKMGGPSVRPPLPKELVGTLLKDQWKVTPDESEHDRRSIYVFARRNLRYPIFEVFDRPSANASCADRGASTTAPQSLHLLNSQFTFSTAQHLSKQIMQTESTQESQVRAAFLRTLGRTPVGDELDEVNEFLSAGQLSRADQLTHLCLSLFNCSEFVVID